MGKVIFKQCAKSNLPLVESKDTLVFCTDTLELYKGDGNSLNKYSDIIILENENDRESLFIPLSNKFYYVKESNRLYFYGDDWCKIGGDSIEKVNISTNSNITLSTNKLYDIISANVKGSTLTLPVGTETGQSIEILVSVSGFDINNIFTVTGNINGVASNTITIKSSFVDYKFIWSETSQTWVCPLA
jgi:hypothetical protein